MLTRIAGIRVGALQVVADGLTRQLKVTGKLADGLAFDKMTTTNFSDGFHVGHSRFLR